LYSVLRLFLHSGMANRGPYKRYEEYGSQHSVPRQTLHRRRIQERQSNENIITQNHYST
jgi:hypothetical protein